MRGYYGDDGRTRISGFNREEGVPERSMSTPSIDSILSDESLEKGSVVHKTRGIDVGTGEKRMSKELKSYTLMLE